MTFSCNDFPLRSFNEAFKTRPDVFLILMIPLVGLIMLFVWAFGDGTHPSKKTWAQASLIMMLIGIVLAIIFIGVIISMFGSLINSGMNIQSV